MNAMSRQPRPGSLKPNPEEFDKSSFKSVIDDVATSMSAAGLCDSSAQGLSSKEDRNSSFNTEMFFFEA